MQINRGFTVYNASAGSGKTYTLVKEYLKILFNTNNYDGFKRILAITFTNKAVAEMKTRIIDTLKMFSNPSILKASDNMFDAICIELNIEPELLHLKAKRLLKTIIHNYAAFDISTIDGFTHKLIRTFAYDLKLPLNFEVELDQNTLLSQSVDNLIAKAGTDVTLTNILVDFAIEKVDDDKSWDIAFDFNKLAKLLVSENDIKFIEKLTGKTTDDFSALKTQLKKTMLAAEKSIINKAKSVLNLIQASALEDGDFTRSSLPKHFKSLSTKNFDVKFEAKWQNDLLEGNTLHPKRISEEVATTISQIQPQLLVAFNETKEVIYTLKFLKRFYKNITPLSVLSAIDGELKILKEEQNKMLISEFNAIISKEIKAQPTPFIYERIGEKFKHFFIDEFQDTSVMQWENLIPLLGNSLATNEGTTVLLGDAKQAIYRWRGGKAEQFIGLFNEDNPFYVEKNIKDLPDNYRSFKAVVNFNNNFFNYLSKTVFNNEAYKNLYENAHQNTTKKEEGYVEISFLDIEKGDDRDTAFCEHVHQTITNCLKQGFVYQDICVLVRKKTEGIAIADYLTDCEIPIISSETLLIKNSHEVMFVTNVLSFLVEPENNELKINILNYLSNQFNIDNKHDFFVNHINLSLLDLFKSLEKYNVVVSGNKLQQLPLFDLVETIFRSFNLLQDSNAYIQFYLDFVLEFSQKKGASITKFIQYFNTKKDNLSIISSKEQNAIQIMTIHKSKGLEFPIVIFPYADLDIYKALEPKVWYQLEEEAYNGFPYALLDYNKEFEYYGEQGAQIHNQYNSEQELDNINLLYVALTRPVEQLYIVSKNDSKPKNNTKPSKYSNFLINYLKQETLWNDAQLTYSFGNRKKITQEKNQGESKVILQEEFISTDKSYHNINVISKSGYLWDTNQEKAIEKGNLIHQIMSQIKTADDIDFILNDFLDKAVIAENQLSGLKETITEIVFHPMLKDFYNSTSLIYNERDIIINGGTIVRPDRIIVEPNKDVTIIDYKTGHENLDHINQLNNYAFYIEEMSYKVRGKILVYIDESIEVKFY